MLRKGCRMYCSNMSHTDSRMARIEAKEEHGKKYREGHAS